MGAEIIGKKCLFDRIGYKSDMVIGEIVDADHDYQRLLIMCEGRAFVRWIGEVEVKDE